MVRPAKRNPFHFSGHQDTRSAAPATLIQVDALTPAPPGFATCRESKRAWTSVNVIHGYSHALWSPHVYLLINFSRLWISDLRPHLTRAKPPSRKNSVCPPRNSKAPCNEAMSAHRETVDPPIRSSLKTPPPGAPPPSPARARRSQPLGRSPAEGHFYAQMHLIRDPLEKCDLLKPRRACRVSPSASRTRPPTTHGDDHEPLYSRSGRSAVFRRLGRPRRSDQ